MLNDWTFAYFDLTAAAGKTVEIGFRADAQIPFGLIYI